MAVMQYLVSHECRICLEIPRNLCIMRVSTVQISLRHGFSMNRICLEEDLVLLYIFHEIQIGIR
jgi:hypothetical protein